jgi:hypothetical protein
MENCAHGGSPKSNRAGDKKTGAELAAPRTECKKRINATPTTACGQRLFPALSRRFDCGGPDAPAPLSAAGKCEYLSLTFAWAKLGRLQCIVHDPHPEREARDASNRLPAPAAAFNVTMRLYEAQNARLERIVPASPLLERLPAMAVH